MQPKATCPTRACPYGTFGCHQKPREIVRLERLEPAAARSPMRKAVIGSRTTASLGMHQQAHVAGSATRPGCAAEEASQVLSVHRAICLIEHHDGAQGKS
jgi:hypothetical protein